VHASGERGNPLVDAASVRLALSALHLADHPSDETAWLHLASSPLAGAFGLSAEVLAPLAARGRPSPDAAAAGLAARIREELLTLGYGGWLARREREVRAVRTAPGMPVFDAWERGRFGQLVALGLRWDARATLRPADFVASVRATRVDHPAAAGVRVMTVHAAKGLEFDAVVLPDLDDAMTSRLPDLWAVRREARGRFTRVMPSPGKDLLPFLAEAKALHDELQARALEESLCVLYVAMTRARHRLDLLVQPADVKPKVSRSYARLLRHALGEGSAAGPEDTTELWRHPESDEAWCPPSGRARASTPRAPGVGPARQRLVLATGCAPRRPAREAPSGLAGGPGQRAADILSDAGGLARARGSVIHRWLADVEWLHDFDAAGRREELLALGRREAHALGVDAAVLPAWFEQFVAMLARPTTRAQLRQADSGLAGEGVELGLWRERAFAVTLPPDAPGEAGRLMTGSFDRVVLARRGGALVAAQVLDWKTDAVLAGAAAGAGAVDEAALADRTAHHRPQMAAYRAALVALTGLPPAKVACRLFFLSADRAVDV
jgi:hypothetical protein